MSKLLINKVWYERIQSRSLYEDLFSAQLEHHSPDLFPGRHFVPFAHHTNAPGIGAKKADYALIDKDYRDWWVVEVEMSHHPLHRHVEPQVRVLAQAKYGIDHAEALLKHAKFNLDEQRLKKLILSHSPRVFVPVLTVEELPDWIAALSVHNALVTFFELYRAPSGEGLFRVSGDLPQDLGNKISACTIDDQLLRALVVKTQSALAGVNGSTIRIQYKGGETLWKYQMLGDTLMLFPRGRFPLSEALNHYVLVRTEAGDLELQDDLTSRRN